MTVISALWCAICTWNKAGNSRMSVSTTKPRACYSVICIKKRHHPAKTWEIVTKFVNWQIFFVKEYFLFCHKDNVGEPKRTCIMRKSQLFCNCYHKILESTSELTTRSLRQNVQFCHRSVPIIRYFQHLIEPLFFHTWGRFISHVIAFALALDLSSFVCNHWCIRLTVTRLAHIILSLSMKPVNRIHLF